jgi:hypothetical protein
MLRVFARTAAAATPIIAFTGWTFHVREERSKTPANKNFVVGSIDDMLAERLGTGDLLFFRRDWTLMYPAGALLTLLGRALVGEGEAGKFDSVAIVVRDRFGVPLCLESTLKGTRLRRFDERIAYSRSEEIVAVPLKRPLSDEQRQVAERFARSLTPERTLKWRRPSDTLVYDALGLIKLARAKFTGDKDAKWMGGDLMVSRSIGVVLLLLDRLSLVDWDASGSQGEPQLLTPADIRQGSIILKDNDYNWSEEITVRHRDSSTAAAER